MITDSQDTENIGKLLAVAAYAGADHGRRLIEGLKMLERLHSVRDRSDDPRCRTCRDSRGRPAPFPCATSLLMTTSMSRPGEGYGLDDESIVFLRNVGRTMNGQVELPDGGVRRELAPYLDATDSAPYREQPEAGRG